MTRVVYLGGFTPSWRTEVHVARDFETIGCQVDRVELPASIEHVLDIGAGADVVLWTKDHGRPLGPEWTDVWRQLETTGARTAGVHLDLFWGIGRDPAPWDPFFSLGSLFTADGSRQAAALYRRLGVRSHHWMPPAVVSDEVVAGTRRRHLAHDVVFVGQPARSYPRAWPFRGRLIDACQRRYGRRFAIYPGRQPIRGLELNDLYASAGVVIGDSLCPKGWSRYWSDRLPETIGRGGFLVFPAVPGLAEHFEPDRHLGTYRVGDLDGALAAIDGWLERPEDRAVIQAAGQAHVRDHHTYAHRARAILEALDVEVPRCRTGHPRGRSSAPRAGANTTT